MARRWSAVLARLGVPTGDGRILAPGGITSRELPLPLLWQGQTQDGHGGSMVVGRIESVSFGDGMVTATGSMLDTLPYAAEEQIASGVVGPSVDLDEIEYQMNDAEQIVITRGRIAGATLVPIPAFEGVSITMDPMPAMPQHDHPMDPEDMPMYDMQYSAHDLAIFSVRTSGWSSMPIADEGRAWDGAAAADRIFTWAGGPDNINWSKYARGFLRKDDEANPETRGAYGFGIADIIDGTLTIVPRGVFAAAAAVQGSRTGKTPADADAMKRVLRGIYSRMDREAPFSLAASAAPSQLPSVAWFAAPKLSGVTPLTVTPEGRVFGHIAPWGECHVGMPGCVTAPDSPSGYSYFHTGEQRTQEGVDVPVGTLVTGPRHADPQLSFRAAAQHYDDLSCAVAKVVAGEDEFGVWVAGWMLPGADPAKVEQFMSSPVSGDWRRIGGALELIAVCSVNSPGFPVPRARVAFSNGAQRTLVGSFGVRPQEGVYKAPEAAQPVRDDSKAARAKWAWATTEG